MEITKEELFELIKQGIKEGIADYFPKQWLSVRELCNEFGISSATATILIKDPTDPLPYTTMGLKKQLFERADVEAYLRRRKRNT